MQDMTTSVIGAYRRVLVVLWLSGLSLVCLSGAGWAQEFVESFEGGSNEGQWSFLPGGDVIETGGGNPGAYLHVPFLDTFAPRPGTLLGLASEFSGDFRARGITGIGVDLITHSVDFSAGGRPLTLLLTSDQGTPGDLSDDWAAYVIGPANIPMEGEGWLSYSFVVPSASPGLPAGWATLSLGASSPPAPDWNALITDVDRVSFFYGDPNLVFIFQGWDLGLDNARIVAGGVFQDGFETGDVSAWASMSP